MDNSTKKNRIEYLFEVFLSDYEKAAKGGALKKVKTSVGERYVDEDFTPVFAAFFGANDSTITGATPAHTLFNYFILCDPTTNKEYVNWFMNMYRTLIRYNLSVEGWNKNLRGEDKPREPISRGTFFEDLLSKGKEALEVYNFIKKTNALSVENRDINKFKNVNDFVNMIKPYISSDEGDDSVHTLDHRELTCIHNFVESKSVDGQAEIVFDNENWVIVITHDKEANVEFGKYTSWCTAGSRHQSMFDHYHGNGELFVLIKKGFGAKKMIKSHPTYRMQFHFETDQFMDANDRRIDINKFLFDNKDVKSFFRTYIVKNVLPKKESAFRSQDIIKYLLNLGYGDEIIKILKESKPEIINFSGYKIESEYLTDIGEISSATTVDLGDCGLTTLPDSMRKMKKLKKLIIRSNPNLITIPTWINELSGLEYFDCSGCGISEVPDVSDNKSLMELVLDINPKLTSLPPGIGNLKHLERITASECDLFEITDEILGCTDLYLLDVHDNKNLSYIPEKVSSLPNVEAICFDMTKIPATMRDAMIKNGNGHVGVIYYGA